MRGGTHIGASTVCQACYRASDRSTSDTGHNIGLEQYFTLNSIKLIVKLYKRMY